MPMAIMYFDSRCVPYAYLSVRYDAMQPDAPRLMEDERSMSWPAGPRPGERFTGTAAPRMRPQPITGSGYAILTRARGTGGDAATLRRPAANHAAGAPGAMAAPKRRQAAADGRQGREGGRHGTEPMPSEGAGPLTIQKAQNGPRGGQAGPA